MYISFLGFKMAATDRFGNSAVTFTFCESGENHVGNQIVGTPAAEGFTFEELVLINETLQERGIQSRLVNLTDYLSDEVLPAGYQKEDAGVLVIPNGVSLFGVSADAVWEEVNGLIYDKHALMYGRVVQKRARHNLIIADFDQEAKYEEGKGTVVDFKHVPLLSQIREGMPKIFGEKARGFIAEANKYFKLTETGIKAHSDLERRRVIGVRLGSSFPLVFWWYLNCKRVSERIDFSFDHGDVYIMSEKTVAPDGRKRKIPILRHAAGAEKYIK